MVRIVRAHHDSPRGSWTYSEWRPPALAGLVELLWETRGTTTEPNDRHYPHGMFELLLNLMGNRYRLLANARSACWGDRFIAPTYSRSMSRTLCIIEYRVI